MELSFPFYSQVNSFVIYNFKFVVIVFTSKEVKNWFEKSPVLPLERCPMSYSKPVFVSSNFISKTSLDLGSHIFCVLIKSHDERFEVYLPLNINFL